MIIFCEDCGKKNHIAESQIDNLRAVFKCTACGYHNNFALRPKQVPGIANFEKLLIRKISADNQLIGGFVYGQKMCILNRMPPSLKPTDVAVLAQYLSRSYKRACSQLDRINELAVTIGNKKISCIKNSQGLVLALIRQDDDKESMIPAVLEKAFHKLKV